jgi:hypothetical protein
MLSRDPVEDMEAVTREFVLANAAGLTDAPNDGTLYGRKSLAWAHLTHSDIIDWAATLAPYALVVNIPAASITLPSPSGVAAIGTSATYARADHVHPVPAPDVYSHENRIINGDMRIDQRNNGAMVTPAVNGAFPIDRWKLGTPQVSKINAQRGVLGAGMIALGWPYSLNVATAAAYTPAAGEAFVLFQPIEADMIGDFAWGTANAQPVTLSFMALGSIAGTYGGSIRNTDNSRSYPFSFTLAASTWTKVVVNIPGDTGGTWVLSGSGMGLTVSFDLGAVASLRGPANAWAAANYAGVTGAVSMVANVSATMSFTGVKLEIGSVATPFNRQSLAKSMADCQRYYSGTMQLYSVVGNQIAGQTFVFSSLCPIPMRAIPTTIISNNASSNWTVTSVTSNAQTIAAVGTTVASASVTLNVLFNLSAEL